MRTMAAAAALLALACARAPDAEALRVVEEYNRRVVEAYRAGDVRLVEGIVGVEEETRLTGLIGAKLDQGITLDARLVELRTERVERDREELRVLTRERWEYRDRRIGSGEQVGDASTDRYAMRYHLRKLDGRWVVHEIAFAEPPEVGRTSIPTADVSVMHGVDTRPPEEPAPAPAAGASGHARRAHGEGGK